MKDQCSFVWQIIKTLNNRVKRQRIIIVILVALLLLLGVLWGKIIIETGFFEK